jgi:hypothetical protein
MEHERRRRRHVELFDGGCRARRPQHLAVAVQQLDVRAVDGQRRQPAGAVGGDREFERDARRVREQQAAAPRRRVAPRGESVAVQGPWPDALRGPQRRELRGEQVGLHIGDEAPAVPARGADRETGVGQIAAQRRPERAAGRERPRAAKWRG